jgi:hypothetical protein
VNAVRVDCDLGVLAGQQTWDARAVQLYVIEPVTADGDRLLQPQP